MFWREAITIQYADYFRIEIYPIDIAIFLFCLVVFGTVLVFLSRLNGRQCRWQRVKGSTTPPFTKWVCRVCAVEAFSLDGRAPKECKKALQPTI